MKKITAKVITISSQILVVSIFLVLLFSNKGNNNKLVIVDNNNFDKMADSTLSLFKEEEMLTSASSDDVIVSLADDEKKEEVEEPIPEVKEEEPIVPNLFYDKEVLKIEIGTITGYGPDCSTCSGNGTTKSGYNLYNSMYYEDSEFGTVRILAADPSFGENAIFRVSNIPGMDPFIAIVLDTGGNVGYGKGTLFDLAYATESDPNLIGLTRNVKFELLREGIPWKW